MRVKKYGRGFGDCFEGKLTFFADFVNLLKVLKLTLYKKGRCEDGNNSQIFLSFISSIRDSIFVKTDF